MANRPPSQEVTLRGSGVKIARRESAHGSGNTVCNEAKACGQVKTEEEEMKQQQRMKTMTDMISKRNSAWTRTTIGGYPEWEETVQPWFYWLHEMKKKDVEKRKEEKHQKLVKRVITSAEGRAGFLHRITGGVQFLEEEEEDVSPLARCEEKRREWAKHWQAVET